MNIVILRSTNECKIVIIYAGILHHTTGTLQQEHYTNNLQGSGELASMGPETHNKRSPTQRVNFILTLFTCWPVEPNRPLDRPAGARHYTYWNGHSNNPGSLQDYTPVWGLIAREWMIVIIYPILLSADTLHQHSSCLQDRPAGVRPCSNHPPTLTLSVPSSRRC